MTRFGLCIFMSKITHDFWLCHQSVSHLPHPYSHLLPLLFPPPAPFSPTSLFAVRPLLITSFGIFNLFSYDQMYNKKLPLPTFIYKCLSVMLDSLSCSFTSIYFLTIKTPLSFDVCPSVGIIKFLMFITSICFLH